MKLPPDTISADTTSAEARRPIKTRDSRFARSLAKWIAGLGVSPDAVSIASIGFGVLGAAGFLLTRASSMAIVFTGLLLAIVGMQLRLICNLIDGMVAVEYGRKTRHGELSNDIPDRISDSFFFIAAGYAADPRYGVVLGFSAALAAMFTAYMRTLGKSVGAGTYFTGPMAKQHRMFVMCLACVAAGVLYFWALHREALSVGLLVVLIGSVLTALVRFRKIVADLYRS